LAALGHRHGTAGSTVFPRRRGKGLGRREARIVFLPKIFIEDKNISPTPKRPNTFRSVVDLSTTVFQDVPFKKLKPSKKEKKT
jgi:hypothetical protein